MNTFEKSQAAKMLACYITPEEIQKGDDSEKISMTKKDFKEEHENLIKVLESPSKEDDKEEIKEQEKEAKDYGVELEKADTFKKSQSAKLLACYLSEDDIEKAHPAGYINAHGKQKQADGSWKYVGKGKATAKQESKPESNSELDAVEEHFENKRKNLHETHSKEVDAHYEKMNADSLHHQKLYNDAMKENKPIEELKKLNDAHNESHLKNQADLKALHSRHDSERSALIKEYSEARKKIKEGSKPKESSEPKSGKLMTQGMYEAISKLGQASDKEKINAARMYAQQAGNTYTESEYNQILDEWTDTESKRRKNLAKDHASHK